MTRNNAITVVLILHIQGNITKYGILEIKKEEWACDKAVVRRTGTTHYQDTFVYPGKEALASKVNWREPRCNPITWECPLNAKVPTM